MICAPTPVHHKSMDKYLIYKVRYCLQNLIRHIFQEVRLFKNTLLSF